MLNVDLSSLETNGNKALPRRYLENVLEILRYAVSPNRANRRINRLMRQLRNLGFHERAGTELWEIVQKTNGYGAGALAAKGLLQFCMDHPNPACASIVKKCLAITQRAAVSATDKRTTAIMAAEFYRSLGELERAKKTLSEAISSQSHVDLLLASANLEQDPRIRLEFVNIALESQGLCKIFINDKDGLELYDRIDVDISQLLCVDRPELISIIMPAYNSASTIETALNSIQNQSWTNFECIIVDDCSSDNTVEVVEGFISDDARFKLIRLKENAGAYVARNTGLETASGEFITCHDADDWSHPSKLELQVNCLLNDSQLLASASSQARMLPDLSFTRRGMFGAYMGDNFSSLMLRRVVFERMGYWDSVRFAADGEFMRRFKAVFGKQSLVFVPKLLSFPRYSLTSLTGGTRFGFNGYFFGARQYYFERLTEHHKKKGADLRYSFPMLERPFTVPKSMSPVRNKCASTRHFDVIIASDFRMDGGSTLSSIEEVQAQHRAGLRTGIVQMCRYDYDAIRGLNPKVTALLDSGSAEIIVYGEEVTCDLLLVRYPPVLQHFQVFVPNIKARNIKVLVNQPPMSDYGKKARVRYTIPECVKNLNRYFAKEAIWHPIGPSVRGAISEHHREWLDKVEFSEWDWHNIVDLRDWRRSLEHKISDRPIIGRHSRDHNMKWPADRKTMQAVYPNGKEFEVRVLGGAKYAEKILGSRPANWTVYPFDSVSPAEFLKSLDVFVYFTNDAWVESFGRVIIEAMSVGVPVILPFSYKPLFEDAALYCTPEDVQPLVRKLVSDPEFYRSQVERAFAYVDEKFGYDMHIERVKPYLSDWRGVDNNLTQ